MAERFTKKPRLARIFGARPPEEEETGVQVQKFRAVWVIYTQNSDGSSAERFQFRAGPDAYTF